MSFAPPGPAARSWIRSASRSGQRRPFAWSASFSQWVSKGSGVARSRSDALAWAVRLVGQNADEWLGELREAMARVDELRARGPVGEDRD